MTRQQLEIGAKLPEIIERVFVETIRMRDEPGNPAGKILAILPDRIVIGTPSQMPAQQLHARLDKRSVSQWREPPPRKFDIGRECLTGVRADHTGIVIATQFMITAVVEIAERAA